MSDHIKQTIADLEKKVLEYESHAIRVKATINELCGMAGLPMRYSQSELGAPSGGGFNIRSDQFHGRPLATCVREYLEMRKRADLGPASTNEIFDALSEGGYESNTKNEQVARVSLYNSLTKNAVFYKLPNKKWGLSEWYPNAKKKIVAEDDDDGDPEEIGSYQVEENRRKREANLAAQEAAEKEQTS